ncbi:acetylcholine receptor subunit beta-like [Centruroides sculpturatus]|uniref:acetylcholine receptor subunit beta-like n=1 Tax=Centruroides sculpturatus TaxID=218467 RepID=UPI000C6D833D|nr:acetylcholine receptor subunit beta-like [Centruroides sculpturatus]
MFKFICWILFLSTLLLAIKKINSENVKNDTLINYYKKLRSDLQLNYDVRARPVKYHSNVTQVQVDIFLVYVFDVNEEKQTALIDVAIGLIWTDSFLTWDPSKYNGITKLDILPNEIWKPDIFEMRSGDPNSALTESKIAVRLYPNGVIVWYIPTSLTGRCTFKYNNYPTDTATCEIILENFVSRGNAVDILVPFDKPYTDFLRNDNPYWNIEDSKLKRRAYNHSNSFYPSAILTLSLSRRQPTIQQQLLWIISVISSLLTFCMLWIPTDVRQKLTIGCVVLVILSVGLVAVESSVRVFKVSIFIANIIDTTMYVVVTTVILEIIIISLQHVEDFDPPEFILKIFSGKVSRFLLINHIFLEEKNIDTINLYENQDEIFYSQKISKNDNWKIFGQIIDRMLFFIYLIILCVIHIN